VKGLKDVKGHAVVVAVVVALMTSLMLAVPVTAAAQQLVIVVRHAERADGGHAAAAAGGGGSGMSSAPADPLLSAAGAARAARLAVMLADANVKAIFATEFRRTQDTGKPLADKLGLKVQNVRAADTRIRCLPSSRPSAVPR
jgi:hypothetical protein